MTKSFTITVKGEEVTFDSPYDTLDDAIQALRASGNRSDFARDLCEKFEKFGLSDKQAAWVHRLATQPPREQREPLHLGLTGIASMLRAKPGKGQPKLEVARGIVVALNSQRSKHPGHVTCTDGGPFEDNKYFCRISPEGIIYPGRDFTDEVQQALVAFNNQNQETNDDLDDDLPF